MTSAFTLFHAASAVHALAALGTSAHAILHHPQARGAALWLCVVWLVPWLGPFIYILIGVNRVPRRARGATPPELTGGSWRHGNHLSPLVGGDAAYAAMIAAVDSAITTVQLATYIFDHDRAGALFVEAFRRATDRGVDVHVLIDAVGVRYSRPSILRPLLRTGASVAMFMPTSTPWRWRYANLRNHRKLMVADRHIGFVGGMNIREACALSLAPAAPTLDMHFRVVGPLVADLAELFAADWAFATGNELQNGDGAPCTAVGQSAARLIHGGPDRSDEPIRWLKLAAVVRAVRRVRIVTPYFVPDEDVVTALCAAVSAGVHIQIVMPSVNNLRLVAWASRACWTRLIDRGIEIVLSPPPFDHTKLMLVDDDIAIIGSANWDERSFRLNFEADVEVRDPAIVTQLDMIVDARIGGSPAVTLRDVAEWPLLTRLRDGAARLALPYL